MLHPCMLTGPITDQCRRGAVNKWLQAEYHAFRLKSRCKTSVQAYFGHTDGYVLLFLNWYGQEGCLRGKGGQSSTRRSPSSCMQSHVPKWFETVPLACGHALPVVHLTWNAKSPLLLLVLAAAWIRLHGRQARAVHRLDLPKTVVLLACTLPRRV